MSTVDNLIQAGKAVAELGAVLTAVVANGKNYFADITLLPKLAAAGQDIVTAVKNYQADMAEIKNLDEAGRTQLAAAWAQDIPALANQTVDQVLQEGVTVVTYGLEAIAFLLRTYGPKPTAA